MTTRDLQEGFYNNCCHRGGAERAKNYMADVIYQAYESIKVTDQPLIVKNLYDLGKKRADK